MPLSVLILREHQQTEGIEFSFFYALGMFLGGQILFIQLVSDVTVVEMPISQPEAALLIYLSSFGRVLRKYSCLAEQKYFYLGIKVLTTAIFYQGFLWLFCMTWNYRTL